MRALTAALTTATITTCMFASTAFADPTLRAGLTVGLRDDSVPDTNQVGPVAGIGWRFGKLLMVEADYAYLSFEDSATLSGGVHRVGALVRAELMDKHNDIGDGYGVYGEAGIGERIGRWEVDAAHVAPASGYQREAHLGGGLDLSNRRLGYGWLLGVRVAFAPHDPSFAALCRGDCPTSAASTSGTDVSVLFEASVLLGH